MTIHHKAVALRHAALSFDEPAMAFEGYGAVFGNVDAVGDVIVPGAFAEFLRKAEAGDAPWPAMLFQHGGGMFSAIDALPIGAWEHLAEDDRGLKVRGRLNPESPRAREIYALMKMQPRPGINGLSIGYHVRSSAKAAADSGALRLLQRIDLVEVSVVMHPANHLARISAVKADQLKGLVTERLIEVGFSQTDAAAFAAAGFEALGGPVAAAGRVKAQLQMLRDALTRR